jgi:hypothetical protein
LRLWDIGDKVQFDFGGRPGKYVIRVRLRSGLYALTSSYANPTAYFADGYSFKINGSTVTFTGDPSSVSGKDPSYGGSYWGNMNATMTLSTYSRSSLEITANKQWLGIDYIDIIPVEVGKLEAESIYLGQTEAGTRPLGTESYATLSGGSSAKIWDPGDKISLPFFTSGGTYRIGVRVRSGAWSGTYAAPTVFWPNGYSFALDNAPITLTGDPTTVSGKDASYGGSYWGTMKSSSITLSQGWHTLYVTAVREWAGVDYIVLEPIAAPSSARLAVEEIQIDPKGPFPNPFDRSITLEFDESVRGSILFTLSDPFGKVHYTEKRNINEGKAELDLQDIKPGVFFLKVKSAEREKIYRVIKN